MLELREKRRLDRASKSIDYDYEKFHTVFTDKMLRDQERAKNEHLVKFH